MYARLINFQGKPNVTPSHANALYAEIIDHMRQLDGFEGSLLLMSESTHHAISLSFWRDRDAADASGQSLLPLLYERVSEFVTEPPSISGFDVIDTARFMLAAS